MEQNNQKLPLIILLIATAVILSITFQTQVVVRSSREQATALAMANVENKLRTTVVTLNGSLQTVGYVLSEAAKALGALDLNTRAGVAQANQTLSLLDQANEELHDIVVVTRFGATPLAAASENSFHSGVDIPDEFKRRLFDGSRRGSIYSHPIAYYLMANGIVLVGEPMLIDNAPAAIVAVISAQSMERYIAYNDEYRIVVEGSDGTIIFAESPVGGRRDNAAHPNEIQPDGKSRISDGLGGGQIIIAASPVLLAGARVVVSASLSGATKGNQTYARFEVWTATIECFIVLIIAFFLYRATAVRERKFWKNAKQLNTYLAAIKSSKVAILICDDSDQVVIWNHAMEALFPTTVNTLNNKCSLVGWLAECNKSIECINLPPGNPPNEVDRRSVPREKITTWTLKDGRSLVFREIDAGNGIRVISLRDVTKEQQRRERLLSKLALTKTQMAEENAAIREKIQQPANAIAGVISLIASGQSISARDQEILRTSLMKLLVLARSIEKPAHADSDLMPLF